MQKPHYESPDDACQHELEDARLALRSKKALAETKPLQPAPQEQLPLTGDALANELIFHLRARLNELVVDSTVKGQQLRQKDNIIAGQNAIIQRLESERLALIARIAELTRVREGSD